MLVSGFVERPDYRVDLLPRRNRVTVQVGEQIVASSNRTIVVDEQGHGLVFYFPPVDVDVDRLDAIDQRTTFCPFKGIARYFAASTAPELPIAWTYADPFVQVAALAGYIAFYQDRAIITVGGEDPIE